MQLESTTDFRKGFLLNWFLANAIGLSFGWVVGEWMGLQAASLLGWNFGQIIGFAIFEGSVWLFRWAVLSRIRAYDVLKPIDTVLWLAIELVIGLGMSLSSHELSYHKESLFGIVSLPILTNYFGVMGWLILWLTKVQAQKTRTAQSQGKSILASLGRVGGSLLIFFFLVIVMPVSTSAGEAAARISNWMLGRAVAGALMGGLLSLLTGLAILKLLRAPSWDENM